MSCNKIYYKNGAKMMSPVTTEAEYRALRNTPRQVTLVSQARRGDSHAKRQLQQFNYSCLPNPDGTLRGTTRLSNAVGMDVDLLAPPELFPPSDKSSPIAPLSTGDCPKGEVNEWMAHKYKEIQEQVLSKKDELGLLMLEKSATKGYHIVFRRHPEMSQEDNLRWMSEKLGVQYDEAAKDITRVFFSTTASPEDLLFLSPELFENGESPSPQTLSAPSPQPGHILGDTQKSPTTPSAPTSLGGEGVAAQSMQTTSTGNSYPEYYETNVTKTLAPSEANGERGSGAEERGCSSCVEGSIPYSMLVSCLQELLGGVPAHGSRNNFIFSMAAYLRYVCDDDPEWIKTILPTYGEAKEKWARTIESACQRAQYKVMPQIVKRAIENARQRSLPLGGDEGGPDLPPAMPQKLPKLIAHLVKNVPEVCRPAVANAVFPALAAHLNGVKFRLIDGTEKEATFMCVTMAKQSSGKSAVNKPIDYITADIVERDEINRKREQEWKDATAQKGANKEKPKRPDDLCVQVLVSDMTNAAFVQRMKDAGGKYLYTNLEELDLLKQLQTNGTKDVGKIICLCFDNGKYGQERVGTQSVTARVDIRWNWNAASTIQKGIQFFKGRLVDGTLSRINFCTIIPDNTKPFVYGRYDEKYAETLKPFITNLNLATGQIECKQAIELAKRMEEKCAEEGALSDDDVYQDLSHRAVTIAYLKAMVLYIANDMTWSKEIADFAEWSLNYDLWCKSHFFGDQITEEKAKEDIKTRRGKKNLLDMLPESFSVQEASALRQQEGMSEDARHMVNVWVNRGYIEQDSTGRYVKTDMYQKRKHKLN